MPLRNVPSTMVDCDAANDPRTSRRPGCARPAVGRRPREDGDHGQARLRPRAEPGQGVLEFRCNSVEITARSRFPQRLRVTHGLSISHAASRESTP